uniref:Uncharacterized protein n=1 Tax=Rhizophora mucronata TaxID=61149 RepID=A0A2P2JN36_RHIMU
MQFQHLPPPASLPVLWEDIMPRTFVGSNGLPLLSLSTWEFFLFFWGNNFTCGYF